MDAYVLARPAERPSDGLDQMDIVPVEIMDISSSIISEDPLIQ